MWLTLEYAINFLKSVCAIAQSAPYTILIRAKMASRNANFCANSGKIGKLIRINPYVPIFNRTPARMTLIAVGASTCASGSHVWKGKMGTLIAKPINNAKYARVRRYVPAPASSEPDSKFAGFIIASMLNV